MFDMFSVGMQPSHREVPVDADVCRPGMPPTGRTGLAGRVVDACASLQRGQLHAGGEIQ